MEKTLTLKHLLTKLTGFKEGGIILILVVMSLVVGFINGSFFSIANISNMLRTASYTAIIALPMTLILITGGIDLSVGSTLGFGGIIAAYFMVNTGLPVELSMVIAIIFAVAVGLINGFIIVDLNVPAFMGTLGTMYIIRGVIYVLTGVKPIHPLPDRFTPYGAGSFLNLSYSVWFVIILAVVFHIFMRHTKLGRYSYAVGGNAETARLSGIDVKFVRRIMYVFSAVGASITGMFIASRIGSAQIAAGTGWELEVIAACVIGGTSTLGGEGTSLGTILGALLMVVMKTAMVMLNVSAYLQNIVVGLIIIGVVAIDQYKRNR
jgi:ribose transport system permease protein